jgi:4a-hydroxytetrahydrobiopterin dehydratase
MWIEEDNALKKNFTFPDFNTAFAFMVEVSKIANEMDHHPYWYNMYNQVGIELQTHDAGDIVTDKDRQMATAIDKLLE